jgi:hypothetical protein
MAKKKCFYCGREFISDPRVGQRQKACSVQCQKIRKKGNNKAFSKNNPGYWHGRYEYVKEWRQKHSDYQRQWRQKRKQSVLPCQDEIQAETLKKAIDSIEKNLIPLRKIQAEIIIKPAEITTKRVFSSYQAL